MDGNLRARRGDVILLETDGHSAFGMNGYFVALKDITAEDFAAAKAEADAWGNRPTLEYTNRREALICALVRADLLSSIPVARHHIDYYSDMYIYKSALHTD